VFSRVKNQLDFILSFPGITDDELILRRNVWLSSFGTLLAVVGLTLLALFLHISIIFEFGLILFVLVFPALIIIPFIRKRVDLLVFLIQVMVLLVTCFYMIRMGGLLHSAGLLFTGMTVIIVSISYQNTKYTFSLFIIYLLSIIMVVVLKPDMKGMSLLTPQQNILFFTINCLWQAGYILFLVISFLDQRRKLEEVKRKEAKQLKELDQFKTKLYTNVTHEFRTPLTVIDGVVFQIENNPRKWLKPGIEKIRTNIRILLNLITQILDYNKMEARAMSVQLIQGDILVYTKYLMDSFAFMAKTKNIGLKFHSGREKIIMDFDPDKIRQIIYNLFSNAIKYTRENGTVTMSLEGNENKKNVILRVSDNGRGIEPEHLQNLFKRYYRAFDGAYESGGTGIGLNITYELVNLLGGNISVKSTLGEGTEFTIQLPWMNKAKKENGIDFTAVKANKEDVRNITKKVGNKSPLVLIVEDNEYVAEFLISILEENYNVVLEKNGENGLLTAISKIPDIIISDIMMPQMNGYEMVKRLKKDIRTSHIPVIFLTAKVDMESRLEGLEYGAEAYLTKPFHQQELFIRIRKLLEIRQQLYQRYNSAVDIPETKNPAIYKEDTFMLKLREILVHNLDNEEYGIGEICREIGVSRAQLYRKFNALTNISVGRYIKLLRLNKAKELLTNEDFNVSEVAFRVGFKNLSHFSTSFYKEFGYRPSEKKSNV